MDISFWDAVALTAGRWGRSRLSGLRDGLPDGRHDARLHAVVLVLSTSCILNEARSDWEWVSAVRAVLTARAWMHAASLIVQVQWETADPSWSIRRRPDILATLYQIGFERSRPHGAPRSNRFAQRVLEATRLAWLQEAVTAGAAPVVASLNTP